MQNEPSGISHSAPRARQAFARLRQALLILLLLPLLAACKVELYSGLSEQEANTVVAVLLTHGIDAEKASGKDKTANVKVDKADLARAVEILNANGLPREKSATLGEIFKKQGLISSPVEERARLIYALSQELSGTLGRIDGIVWARVHIVLSEGDIDGGNATPSSAAVLIRYVDGYDVPSLVPQVKRLVTNSIAGLRYEKVSVVLVKADTNLSPSDTANNSAELARFQQDAKSAPTPSTGPSVATIALLMVGVLAAAGGGVYYWWRRGGFRRAAGVSDGD
jgi:type III secretion protein J